MNKERLLDSSKIFSLSPHLYVGICFIEENHKHSEEHKAAYEFLNSMLEEIYDISYSSLSVTKTNNGKPYFENSKIKFNISHCRGAVVIILSDKYEVGIDIENIRTNKGKIVDKIFSESEKCEYEKLTAGSTDKGYEYDKMSGNIKYEKEMEFDSLEELFFAFWTYKEAMVKLTGEGISAIIRDKEAFDYYKRDKENVYQICFEYGDEEKTRSYIMCAVWGNAVCG